jgi:sugar phosphate isomerase/epimerase
MMKIGTTTFAFRYGFLDPARSPSLESVVAAAADLGLDALQICENARPMEVPESAWRRVVECAAARGVEVQLGCKTTRPEVFRQYLDRAAALPSRFLRVVLEEEQGRAPVRADVDRFLALVWPWVESAGVRLAIENHFEVPSGVLAEAVAPYPAAQVGFCVDTANSLRNFESPEGVLHLLGSRAFCYHVKDFLVEGDKLGFRVTGAPLGEGRLDLDGVLDRILAKDSAPALFVENWVPGTGVREADVHEDGVWLRRGIDVLLARLAARDIHR